MLLGEAPGKREDDLDKPFQGPAGKLLDECLDEVGLDRTQVWIDNVVRCRPPKNRRPEEEEYRACRTYTDQLIRIVKPKVVVLLGATALAAVKGKKGISHYRGKPIPSGRYGLVLMPTWHPAFCLRFPKHTKELINDIQQAREIAEHHLTLEAENPSA